MAFSILCSSKYITDKLLQYCEKLSDTSITSQRKILNNAWFVVPFESNGNLIQFQKTAESFVVSRQPVKAIDQISNAETELPDIYPLSGHISIDKENIYQLQNIYRKLKRADAFTLQYNLSHSIMRNAFDQFNVLQL